MKRRRNNLVKSKLKLPRAKNAWHSCKKNSMPVLPNWPLCRLARMSCLASLWLTSTN